MKDDSLVIGEVFWQVIIHITFVASAIALASIDRLTYRNEGKGH